MVCKHAQPQGEYKISWHLSKNGWAIQRNFWSLSQINEEERFDFCCCCCIYIKKLILINLTTIKQTSCLCVKLWNILKQTKRTLSSYFSYEAMPLETHAEWVLQLKIIYGIQQSETSRIIHTLKVVYSSSSSNNFNINKFQIRQLV